jgi:hypothetical protein
MEFSMSPTMNVVVIALAAVFLVLYLMRRRARMRQDD